MPIVFARPLRSVAKSILSAAGTPHDIAECVSQSLVSSNLKGVDSHGVMRLEWYLEQISDRIIVPAARPSLRNETASSAVLQGNGAFGIYGMHVAGDLAIAKAREYQVSAVALTDVGHTGRLGEFAEKIAAEGMFCIILGGGNHERWGCVAPYGGSRPFLPTNPYAFGVPAGKYGAVIVDFATSAVATGKLRLYRAGGLPIPFGWILDQRGQPSTNAEDFFQGGMQLPAGGPKGYGLAVIAEIIGSALLGAPREFNWLVIAVNLSSFRKLDAYTDSCETLIGELKGVPPAPGFSEVMFPGEPEQKSELEREKEGIPIADEVWRSIQSAGKAVGLDPDQILTAAT
jgi:LDH2 family malate/lactate/ureidoglycolate dehydrogenase